MKDVELGDALNPQFCATRSEYFINYVDKYLIFCDDNDIEIVEEIGKSIEYFVRLKNDFEDGVIIENKKHTYITFYDHFQSIAVGIDMFKDVKFESLSDHVKISERKRKIKNITESN